MPARPFADMIELTAAVAQALDRGMDGLVVTQGTDTIEETAYAARGTTAPGRS